MKLTVLDIFIAEGTEAEIAMYTGLLLDILQQIGENKKRQEALKEIEVFKKLANKSIEDLMKSEGEEEE